MTLTKHNQPCAACKYQRRKCQDDCIFRPHFPPEKLHAFIDVHSVYGCSNVSKLLSDVLFKHRDDAVESLIYEARQRIKNPTYGCTGLIAEQQRSLKQVQQQIINTRNELAALMGPEQAMNIMPSNLNPQSQELNQQQQIFLQNLQPPRRGGGQLVIGEPRQQREMDPMEEEFLEQKKEMLKMQQFQLRQQHERMMEAEILQYQQQQQMLMAQQLQQQQLQQQQVLDQAQQFQPQEQGMLEAQQFLPQEPGMFELQQLMLEAQQLQQQQQQQQQQQEQQILGAQQFLPQEQGILEAQQFQLLLQQEQMLELQQLQQQQQILGAQQFQPQEQGMLEAQQFQFLLQQEKMLELQQQQQILGAQQFQPEDQGMLEAQQFQFLLQQQQILEAQQLQQQQEILEAQQCQPQDQGMLEAQLSQQQQPQQIEEETPQSMLQKKKRMEGQILQEQQQLMVQLHQVQSERQILEEQLLQQPAPKTLEDEQHRMRILRLLQERVRLKQRLETHLSQLQIGGAELSKVVITEPPPAKMEEGMGQHEPQSPRYNHSIPVAPGGIDERLQSEIDAIQRRQPQQKLVPLQFRGQTVLVPLRQPQPPPPQPFQDLNLGPS